jgi:hypothetical protein
MNRLKAALVRFMAGRYGVDQLYYALFAAYIVFFLLGFVAGVGILSLLTWVTIGIMVFRTFSRNTAKRRAENEKYLALRKQAMQAGMRTVNRVKDIKTRRYRKCPHCKAVIRLPRVLGEHTVTCPACKKDFTINIRL